MLSKRRKAPTQSVVPPYDRAAEEAVSREILEQARWMFDQDEKRHDNAQARAAVVLTLTATAVGLLIQIIPETLSCPDKAGLGLVLLAAVTTVICCVMVLRPLNRKDGMPSVDQLRKFAARHNAQDRMPVPATQFAVDLLRAGELTKPSPLNVSRDHANDRMEWLGRAYVSFGLMFGAAVIMLGLQEFI
ncbi:hypothetical protein [Pseudactinotalea sp. Z1732]|uniref:hypothetical protein n=1 Tax=Micrococcales TaxID=85006 RepID=UPI003C7C9D4F